MNKKEDEINELTDNLDGLRLKHVVIIEDLRDNREKNKFDPKEELVAESIRKGALLSNLEATQDMICSLLIQGIRGVLGNLCLEFHGGILACRSPRSLVLPSIHFLTLGTSLFLIKC